MCSTLEPHHFSDVASGASHSWVVTDPKTCLSVKGCIPLRRVVSIRLMIRRWYRRILQRRAGLRFSTNGAAAADGVGASLAEVMKPTALVIYGPARQAFILRLKHDNLRVNAYSRKTQLIKKMRELLGTRLQFTRYSLRDQ